MPITVKAIWSETKGSTKVSFTGLDDINVIDRLDFLQDTLGTITEEYNRQLLTFRKQHREARKKQKEQGA